MAWQINFSGAQPEALSGKTINVTTNADKAAPVTLRWKDGGQAAKANYDDGYALRLEFGALANNRLPGKIYLCRRTTEKSYLMGTFNADARKPKPKPHSRRRNDFNKETRKPGKFQFLVSWFPYSDLFPVMNVELVNTGSELMLGRVLNTHQQWLCRRLADLGHVVTRQVAIADAATKSKTPCARRWAARIWSSPPAASARLPTTSRANSSRNCSAKNWFENRKVLAHIENFFAQRNRPRPAKTSVETFVPEGALVFHQSQYGTAPGLAMQVARMEDGKLRMETNCVRHLPSSILHPRAG